MSEKPSTVPVVVDLRSDYMAAPSQAMREAMATAGYGVEALGEDPDVIALEEQCARMFGMEAALLVTSGCQANLIATMAHCQGVRGAEMIVGDRAHMVIHEQGSHSVVAGVHSRQIKNNPDGTFDLDTLAGMIRPTTDPHQPITALIAVEQTHNLCGGAVVPLTFLAELRRLADKHNVPVHMDGARVMNAAVALGVQVSEVTRHVHSASLCFSKGVGAPAGSILAGSSEFIQRAVRLRKLLGGALRQPGGLAVSAAAGLTDARERMQRDHDNARRISDVITQHGGSVARVETSGLQTNIVMVTLTGGVTAKQLCDRLAQPCRDGVVLCWPFSPHLVRLVTHSSLDSHHVDAACAKLRVVCRELRAWVEGKGATP